MLGRQERARWKCDDSSDSLGVVEQAGLDNLTLARDQDAWIHDKRGASSWCNTFQGMNLQWLNEVKRLLETKQGQENSRDKWAGRVDVKIIQNCKWRGKLRCQNAQWMKGRDQEVPRRQQQRGVWAWKGSGSEDAEPGRPARRGALPLGKVEPAGISNKTIKKCSVHCQRLDVLYQVLKQYLLS